jgi:DNA-binding Xre family transcriptional regulator
MIKREKINIIVKDRRIKLGLTQDALSTACSMTKQEYSDFEDYDDELYMVVKLAKLYCVCDVLGISIGDLFGFESNHELLPTDIICKKMKEKNLSTLELSNFIGIEESYIDNVKDDIVKIGSWTIDPVFSLSNCLEINIGSLLNSYTKLNEKQSESRGL